MNLITKGASAMECEYVGWKLKTVIRVAVGLYLLACCAAAWLAQVVAP